MAASIEFKDVYKRYGAQPVLRGVSFAVERGEIVGLLGPNGCGKTTTLRLIAGFVSPDSGQVRVHDHIVGHRSREARRQIGYLPERPPLYDALRVRDYLEFVAAAKGISRAVRASAVATAMQDYALKNVAHKVIATLSKGYRQRVGLAQATLADPSILLLDEATNGLDALQIVEARSLIRAGAAGRAVIFCSHLMQEVEALCDRVIVLHDGHPVELDDGVSVPRIEIRLRDIDLTTAEVLAASVPGIGNACCHAEGDVVVIECDHTAPDSIDALARESILHAKLLSLEVKHLSLEDRFIAALRREARA